MWNTSSACVEVAILHWHSTEQHFGFYSAFSQEANLALCSVPETHSDRTDQRIFHILISRQVILTSVNLNFMLIACLCPFSCGGKSPVPPTCVFLPSVSFTLKLLPHWQRTLHFLTLLISKYVGVFSTSNCMWHQLGVLQFNSTSAFIRYSIRSHTSHKSATPLSPLHSPHNTLQMPVKSPGCQPLLLTSWLYIGVSKPFFGSYKSIHTAGLYSAASKSWGKKKSNWKSQILNVSSGNLVSHPTKPHISCN